MYFVVYIIFQKYVAENVKQVTNNTISNRLLVVFPKN